MRKSLSSIFIGFVMFWIVMSISKITYGVSCLPSSGDITVYRGGTFGITVTASNICEPREGEEITLCTGTRFNATMDTNIFFGCKHLFHTWFVQPGSGQSINLTMDTLNFKDFKGKDRIIIEITSPKKGNTILAKCDFMLTLMLAEPIELIFYPQNVKAGNVSNGWVILSDPAPRDGAIVNLSSLFPDMVSVPNSITIPPGELSGVFKIHTMEKACGRAVIISATRAQKTVSRPLGLLLEYEAPSRPTGFTLSQTEIKNKVTGSPQYLVVLNWDSMTDVDKFIIKRTTVETGVSQTWEVDGDRTQFFDAYEAGFVGFYYYLYAVSHLCQSPPAGPVSNYLHR